MDEATIIMNMITSVGFPIVACLGMFYYLTKTMDKRDEKIDETLRQMTNVVNENNKLIAIFTDKMDTLFKFIDSKERGDYYDVHGTGEKTY